MRLCASTRALSLKVTLISGSICHYTVGIPEGHSLSLFQPGVLKGVISVTFELFWPLLCWNVLKRGCHHKRLALNLSHFWPCWMPSLTSVAWGTFYSVPWWTLLYCAPWWTLLYCVPWWSLLCLWRTFWMPGGHCCSLSTGCWALCSWGRISLVSVSLPVGPSPSFLKWNLKHLLVLCHISFSLPWPNHQRSWNELYLFCI